MQCVWTSPDRTPPQVLQFRLYEGEHFFSFDVVPDAQAIDVGDRGFVSVTDTDVTLQWVRGTRTAELVYTAGVDDAPEEKRPPLEALAAEVDERLG